MLKDGAEDAVRRELLASEVCQCFDIKQVTYREYIYDGEIVSESDIITSKDYSMVSKMSFDIYACNNDLDTLEVCKKIDPETYYGMNIIDYLTGNTDILKTGDFLWIIVRMNIFRCIQSWILINVFFHMTI